MINDEIIGEDKYTGHILCVLIKLNKEGIIQDMLRVLTKLNKEGKLQM